jgi:hypothetical protein
VFSDAGKILNRAKNGANDREARIAMLAITATTPLKLKAANCDLELAGTCFGRSAVPSPKVHAKLE